MSVFAVALLPTHVAIGELHNGRGQVVPPSCHGKDLTVGLEISAEAETRQNIAEEFSVMTSFRFRTKYFHNKPSSNRRFE